MTWRNIQILAILLIVIYSCKNNTNEEIKAGKPLKPLTPVTVNMIGHWKLEGDRGKLVREVVNEFEYLNQDIDVNLQFPEDLYNANDSDEIRLIIKQLKMPTAQWDIIRIKEHYPAIARQLNDPDWGEKYLVNFADVPDFFKYHQPYINSPLITQRTGNIFIGPYIEGFYWAIYVNMNIAKRVGINVKQYEMTFDDLLSYVKAIYEYNKRNGTNIAAIFEDAGWISTETLFKHLCYSYIGDFNKIIDKKLTPEKVTAIEKGYQALEELSKYEPIIKNRHLINWAKNNDYPLKDSCLFFINGSWMYNIWKMKDAKALSKIMPCELPVFKKFNVYIAGYTSNWAVLKNAPHKEEAIKLMMYWCQPAIAEKWARYTKCPTGVKGALTTSSFGADQYESFLVNIDKKYGGSKVSPVDNGYLFGDKNYNLPLNVIEVLEGKMTAKEAMNQFLKRARY